MSLPHEKTGLFLDGDAHASRSTCDHRHGGFQRSGIEIRHLGFGNALDLILGEAGDLVLIRNAGTGFNTGSLLDQNGSRRSLCNESKG